MIKRLHLPKHQGERLPNLRVLFLSSRGKIQLCISIYARCLCASLFLIISIIRRDSLKFQPLSSPQTPPQ